MELFWSDSIEAGIIRLDRDESAHCVRVLRHRVGDEVKVIDGRGSLFTARLVNADQKGAELEIISEEKGFGAHSYSLTMAVCPTKNIDRFEWFVEKATEMGVDVIAPVIGEHSERKVVKTERLERIALSAAKQSLKAAIPSITEVESVKDFIASAPDKALRLIAYCDETLPREQRISVREALDKFLDKPQACPEICILIGPEGDFSKEEIEVALRHGFLPVHLGASRLRTETAALAAVSAVYFKFN